MNMNFKELFVAMLVFLMGSLSLVADDYSVCSDCVTSSIVAPECHFTLKYSTVDIFSEVLPDSEKAQESHWVYATVLVNCKQETDSYVTVSVYQNGKHIGSGTVVIPAGELSSEETRIDVDPKYSGDGPAVLKLT